MRWKELLVFSVIGLLVVAALLRKDHDVERLVGTWEIVEVVDDGLPFTAKELEEKGPSKVIITRNRISFFNEAGKLADEHIFSIRPGFSPAQIDIRERANPAAASGALESLIEAVTSFGQRVWQGARAEATIRGIYQADPNCLKFCLGDSAPRPSEFRTTKDSGTMLIVLKRSKQ